MVKHNDFDSLLPAYYLGALTPAERSRLERHLRGGCAVCARRAQAYRRVAEALPLSVEPRSPRPELKQALMRRLEPEPAPRRSWLRWPVLAPLAGGLAACLWLVWAGPRPELTAPAPVPALNLVLRSGQVSQQGKRVAPGGALAWGAPIDSGDGKAEIQVGQRAVLLLKPSTGLTLSREGDGVLAQLGQGCVFSAVAHGQAFGVLAGGARVDAHGTLFLVRHMDPGSAYVCICRGSIRITAPGLERVLAAANDAQETGLNLRMGQPKTAA
ncbi:MAG TPA: zf-HC2 domain-containing protein, partial [bacterium]|nr:zf-HC2 domain-containing protein [bacterium]